MTNTYHERPMVKTKIIATLGPSSGSREQIENLIIAGVDIFRLNFAHGSHDWLKPCVLFIRELSKELKQPLAILGDLSGPKIRLGELSDHERYCHFEEELTFVRGSEAEQPYELTSTYQSLVDDLNMNDRVLLADGVVEMMVIHKDDAKVICKVQRPGLIRSRQGINLPGVLLSTPSLTKKDERDLAWAMANDLDYVGLSFVRSAEDIRDLRKRIQKFGKEIEPRIVAKIEKTEAVNQLEDIINVTDAVMVARGDLGVEVDITRVPTLQKRIIKLCNLKRVPVITATQMLESMQQSAFPTRAEASDVANAVLDGSDAVMLSGETAVGINPVKAVSMMSRIVQEAERLVLSDTRMVPSTNLRSRAKIVTEAVVLGAIATAEKLEADMIVVTTHSGRTAMAISQSRSTIPVLALTDQLHVAQKMALYWGVKPVWVNKEIVSQHPEDLVSDIVQWGRKHRVLQSGNRFVLVGSTNWEQPGHDLLIVHVVDEEEVTHAS